MPVSWTTNAQFVQPAAAAGLSVTPSGTAWVNSSYTQIEASTSAAYVLTGVTVCVPGAAVQFEVDVATGAAASEVVVATLKGRCGDATQDWHHGGHLRLPIGVDNIANGVRWAFRIRVSTTSVAAWTFAFTYLKKAITGNLLTSAKAVKVVPSAAVLTSLATSSAGFAELAWTELVAATPTNQVIGALILGQVATGLDYELDIGTGAVGFESTLTTWRNRSTGSVGGPNWHPVENPFDFIPVGSRVSMRWRCNATALTLTAGYAYQEAPL